MTFPPPVSTHDRSVAALEAAADWFEVPTYINATGFRRQRANPCAERVVPHTEPTPRLVHWRMPLPEEGWVLANGRRSDAISIHSREWNRRAA